MQFQKWLCTPAENLGLDRLGSFLGWQIWRGNFQAVSLLLLYMGWFFSFGTNTSVLSCNNVGHCHFYRRLLNCIPSLRTHDLALPRHRSWTVVPVRWVVVSQRSQKTVAIFSKQEQRTWNCWGWEVLYHPLFSRHQSLRLWSHPEDANAREALPYYWRR